MLKEPGAHQHALEMVTLESLVPEDHLLRQIDAFIQRNYHSKLEMLLSPQE